MMMRGINVNGGGGPRNRGQLQKVELGDWQGTVRRLWTYLNSNWHRLLLVFLLTAFTTVVTIVGTRLNGVVIDKYITHNNMRMLLIVCGGMAVMYAIASLATYWQNAVMVGIAQKTSASIRHDIFANMQRLPMRYFDTHSSGDIMSRLTNDVDNINTALMQTFIQLFTGVVSVVGMLAAMLLLSPLLTIIVLFSSACTFFFSRAVAKITQKSFAIQQSSLGELNSQIEESVGGRSAVQVFDHVDATLTTFGATNAAYTGAAYKAQLFSGSMGPFNNMTNNVAYLLITAAGAWSIVSGRGGITVGVIFTFLIYLRNFTGPINNILTLINTLQLALASAERVFAVVDEPAETDVPDAVTVTHTAGQVDFDQVNFGYDANRQILFDVSLTAHRGQTVAIVGETGAGKTTIMNLLTNLYPLQTGAVRLDGIDVATIHRAQLRRIVTVVQQEPFMFTGTIADNIRYGRLDATQIEIEAAAKQANAHNFILQLPDGYATVMTENGAGISQGQRQLLNIARAFVTRAPVLVLDEATASIDSNTELDVQRAMTALMSNRTSFVIAHRLSTIRAADQIIVLDAGRVQERGTHAELIAKRGAYYALYMSQFKGTDGQTN